MQPSNQNFFCPCQFLTQHGAIDVIHPHTKTHMLYKNMWKSCNIQKSKILDGYLADFSMLQLFCILVKYYFDDFEWMLLSSLKICGVWTNNFHIFWENFAQYAEICQKNPIWILLCYRFFAFFIQHSHTEKIFWYHH